MGRVQQGIGADGADARLACLTPFCDKLDIGFYLYQVAVTIRKPQQAGAVSLWCGQAGLGRFVHRFKVQFK
jgi:hypothetical protein